MITRVSSLWRQVFFLEGGLFPFQLSELFGTRKLAPCISSCGYESLNKYKISMCICAQGLILLPTLCLVEINRQLMWEVGLPFKWISNELIS